MHALYIICVHETASSVIGHLFEQDVTIQICLANLTKPCVIPTLRNVIEAHIGTSANP